MGGADNRLIVVCGPARGGTTAVGVMLSEHADILIGREVPLERLPSLPTLLAETAAYHHPHEWTEERRVDVVKALWLAASRPAPYDKPEARRWGMKTPWGEFDAGLWDPLVRPQYVYALRRGDRVFQSHVKLGWSIAKSPQRLIARYKESLRVAERMQAEGRAHIVQLDLAESPDRRRELAEGLFAFLGEEIDPGVERFVEEWPTPQWSFPTSNGGPVELSDEWQQLLAADGEYQELMAAHGY
jgi:hypothetical protein